MKNQRISAKIIADSTNVTGNRLTTMIVTFPRIILAEFNTHRMFSRNSASSRAIPFEKMLKSIEESPFIPIAWQADHKGMQGIEYLNERDSEVCDSTWLVAKNKAVEQAKYLAGRNSTKQLCNRLLEPFMYHTVIVTSSEWENFFALRCPKYEVPFTFDTETKIFRSKRDVFIHLENARKKDPIVKDNVTLGSGFDPSDSEWLKLNKGQAEIHMMALAEAMWDAYNESVPKHLEAGEWHIPFGEDLDFEGLASTYGEETAYEMSIKVATARCARVSYTVVGEEDKKPNFENDCKLHDRLLAAGHMSPFEHCAVSSNIDQYSGNFKGFIQYRKTLPNENIIK